MRNIHFTAAQPDYFKEAGQFLTGLLTPMLLNKAVNLSVAPVPWGELWQFIQTKTLDRTGLDVSEVGTTWLESLARADVLEEFTEDDIARLGGSGAFTKAAWEGAALDSDSRILSIPLMTDTRMIFYWRDMLDAAGINETNAFSTPVAIRETLASLHAANLPAWGVPTFGCINTIHHLASWVWAERADFISPDKRRTSFCDTEAIRGMAGYYNLFSYMPHPFDSFNTMLETFKIKKVAAVMDGPWFFKQLLKSNPNIDISALGIAKPPGPPFLGGSNLIVWKQSSYSARDAAMTLVEHLTSTELQPSLCEALGLLPVRNAIFISSLYCRVTSSEAVRFAMTNGRHLPKTRLWAPLETSLVQAFALVWQNIITGRNLSVTDLLRRHLEPLAKRFDKMIEIF